MVLRTRHFNELRHLNGSFLEPPLNNSTLHVTIPSSKVPVNNERPAAHRSYVSIAILRLRRGVVRASVTRLATRLIDVEFKREESTTICLAQRTSERLTSLDADFKAHHIAVLVALEEEDNEGAATEQDILDKHDDDVASLAYRIDRLIKLSSSVAGL